MIHGVLRENHHLKYDCKMQYGLFLKSLGLAYEDAMEFWKREFTRKMSNDTYNRKYQYLFKHQYGKVGGRIDYRGYDCERICDMEPGPGQHHGCPFKHWDRETLVEKCRADKVNATYLQEIFSLVDRRKFKEACTAYFCATHKVLRESIVQSPNEYVKESFEIEIAVDSYLGAIFESCDTDRVDEVHQFLILEHLLLHSALLFLAALLCVAQNTKSDSDDNIPQTPKYQAKENSPSATAIFFDLAYIVGSVLTSPSLTIREHYILSLLSSVGGVEHLLGSTMGMMVRLTRLVSVPLNRKQ
ncbi:hypothetical protein NQ318_004273 [Aromia moschata]|uniref:DNA primase large subunit C-terminal domain-containing protein n=1 Tax=Aromia moschata TaxID=1265417 RepID=A0AAV8XRG0_9CUCU|nr:hypothetical protein NQ318_004273 [Aromia moschata]